jgi:RHS repeat-associated protein
MVPETPSISAGAVMGAIGKAAGVAGTVMGYAGVAMGALGMAADLAEAAVEDSEAMASAKALSAAMAAAQMAMDAAKMAAEKMMWKDMPVVPPTGSIGAIVDPSHVNVLIGGFPMINIPDPVSALLHRLSRYKASSPPANEGCGEEGEPVDVVSGANLEESVDFPLQDALGLSWCRSYDSSQNSLRSCLGWGWRHNFQGDLRFNVDGISYLPGSGRSVLFPRVEVGASASRDGFTLHCVGPATYRIHRTGDAISEFRMDLDSGIARLSRILKGREEVRFVYDKANRIARIDTNGELVQIEYDPRGLLIRIVKGRSDGSRQTLVSYEYNNSEDLVAWTDTLGNRATLEYDSQHRLIRKGDRRDYSYYYSYDSSGRCVHTWGEDGMYDVRLIYLDGARCTQAVHGDGGVWSFFYDENGTITRIVDPYGNSRERKLNSSGRVTAEIDAAGNEYRIRYDPAGGIMGRQDPFGYLSRDLRDLRRRNHNALIAPATPLEWQFGKLLRPANIEEGLISNNSASGLMSVVHDPLGRKIEEQVREIRKRRWTYDGNGNVLEFEDADGLNHRFEYASWNLLRRQIDPIGNSTEYGYTARERVTKIVDPGGSTSEYAYDLRDNVVEVKRNGVVRERYIRDATDNLIEKRDSNGSTILKFEIGKGNLKSVRRLASGENHYFEYDRSARLTRAATDLHEVRFEYDSGTRPVGDARNGLGVRYGHSGRKHSSILVLNRFEILYSLDDEGTLAITDPTGAKHEIGIDSEGTIDLHLSNGTTEVNSYDTAGRRLSSTRTHPRERAWQRDYVYSAEGDLLAVEDNLNGSSRYYYDAAHRLVTEVQPGGHRADYIHDAAGNLMAKPGLSGVTLGTGNRVKAANGETFTFNDRDHVASYGNSEDLTGFEYDSCDRLVRCVTPKGEWTSTYDPLGRRIAKTWQGARTEYYWDDNRLAAERAPDGSVRLYVYSEPSALVPFMFVDYASDAAPLNSGRRCFVSTNQIGAPIRIEDDRAHVVWRAKVDPYGATHVQPGSPVDFFLRFPGHYEDVEIGLFYNRFRFYSPELGRYIQSDPVGTGGGINLYAYSANPLTNVDLFGLHPPKSEDDEGTSKTGQDEESPEEKIARLREERDARIRERERQAALEEAIAKADASGKLDSLSPEERAWLESDPRNKLLAIDPDGSGGYRVGEAQAALQAEQEGTLTPPVRRATEDAHPSEAGADFVDGNNQTWDHKDASHGADNIANAANPPQGENVLVDSRNQSPAEQQALKDAIDPQLQPGAGKVAHVPRLD